MAIKVYHTDNGIFNISKLMEDISKNQKKIRFSGSGASHQNEAVKRTINLLLTMTSTILMHAALRCHKDTL